MDGHFSDVVPVAEVRAGLVSIDVGNGHKPIIVPIWVVETFCEVTMRKIAAWRVLEAKRVVAIKGRRKRH